MKFTACWRQRERWHYLPYVTHSYWRQKSKSRREYLLQTDNIIVIDWYFNSTKKSNLIVRIWLLKLSQLNFPVLISPLITYSCFICTRLCFTLTIYEVGLNNSYMLHHVLHWSYSHNAPQPCCNLIGRKPTLYEIHHLKTYIGLPRIRYDPPTLKQCNHNHYPMRELTN